MTHRILSSLLLMLLTAALQAAPISQKEAQRIARRALQTDVTPLSLSAEAKSRIGLGANGDTAPAFYLFQPSGSEGFALVSGDDALPALLGYSRTALLDADRLPDALAWWLGQLDSYVARVRSGEIDSPDADLLTADEAATPVVAPLCSSTWNQDDPYNLLCPQHTGEARAMVGCVATAMAQIMYKWKWPEAGTGSVSYKSSYYGTLSANLSQSAYDWDVMKDSYNMLDGKKENTKTMAQLCYDCGLAVKMEYNPSGSGAYDQAAYTAYARNFRYDPSALRLMWRSCCASQEEYNEAIYSELDAGRPMQCSAASATDGGADAAGHSYVLDGYDTNGYVHINWGWGGYADGYFAIPLMNPASYQFNVEQRVIMGITPDYDCDPSAIPLPALPLMLEGSPKVNAVSVEQNATFQVQLDTIWNPWPDAQTVKLGLGLYDLKGNLLENTLYSTLAMSSTISLNGFGGIVYDGEGFSCRLTGTYSDGDYVLRVISKKSGADTWLLPDTEGGARNNWIPVYIHDGALHFNEVSSAIHAVAPSPASTDASPALYDLTGRRVAHPAKGSVYIRGGQKYLAR